MIKVNHNKQTNKQRLCLVNKINLVYNLLLARVYIYL